MPLMHGLTSLSANGSLSAARIRLALSGCEAKTCDAMHYSSNWWARALLLEMHGQQTSPTLITTWAYPVFVGGRNVGPSKRFLCVECRSCEMPSPHGTGIWLETSSAYSAAMDGFSLMQGSLIREISMPLLMHSLIGANATVTMRRCLSNVVHGKPLFFLMNRNPWA